MKRDIQATKAKGFADRRSYIDKLGREVLFGEDWNQRRWELLQRCKGFCEYFVKCRVTAQDPHHIIPRSKGRDDRLSNLQALCRYHHNLMDKRRPMWTKRAK